MHVSRERIAVLQDHVRQIHASARNQERARLWRTTANDEWQPACIRTLPAPRRGGKMPFVVEPALAMWAQILGFDLRAYYSDPLTYLTAQLEMKVYHAQHFPDDTYIDKSLRLLFATLLEGSVMGVSYGFTDQGHPWLDYRHPPLQRPEDAALLKSPDFRSSGVMPLIHRFHGEIAAVLDDDFLIKFPDWLMGPFGVACELRGFDAFLIDLAADPSAAQSLLRVIMEARLDWQQQCDAFLGVSRTRGALGNDDVNCPTLSPAIYRECIQPIEVELCQRSGGISYWHSCGDTTRLLPDIAAIPVLDLFHCGPWTDVSLAGRTFAPQGVPLEIMIETVEKVQMADPAQQRRYIRDTVAKIPDDAACYVKVDSIEVTRDLPTELAALTSWIDAAREVLG